jgi:hypothetical protein
MYVSKSQQRRSTKLFEVNYALVKKNVQSRTSKTSDMLIKSINDAIKKHEEMEIPFTILRVEENVDNVQYGDLDLAKLSKGQFRRYFYKVK